MDELWQWLKRTRGWEAIRKIFLYAENWLQPERRNDQRPSRPPPDDRKPSARNGPPSDRR